MSDVPKPWDVIFEDFLAGLIALDEELKKPENIDPYFRKMEDAGGIHYWQLNQYIAELASELIAYEAEFDALEIEWKQHQEFWGRFLGPAAIQYARNLIADPEYQDEEFAMDWVVPSEENPGSE
jgi:hypothetical protein